jgi:hypothetical protein
MSLRSVVLLIALLPLAGGGLRAQEGPCDPNLADRGVGTFGYRDRGGRCEGIYRRPVATTVLYMVSLVQSFEEFDPQAGTPLRVHWGEGADGTLRLRAEGVRPELYYRLDAERPAESSHFDWPTDVLSGQRLRRRDLGVLGWVRRPLGGVDRDVYVPLRVTQGEDPARCEPTRMLLWPGVRLDSVTVSVAPVDTSGAQGAWVQRDEEVGLGYYPAQRPIEVTLPSLPPSTYFIRLVAFRGGGAPAPFYYHVQVPAESCEPAG